MSEEVYQALKRVIKSRSNAAPFSVGGYKDFLFLKQDSMPKVAANYEGMLKWLVKKYNKQNKEPLPNITPHILRHTFCTRLANAGMNPKALQYIMGHANITMTIPVPNSNTKPMQYLPTINSNTFILINKGRFSRSYARNLPHCFSDALFNFRLLSLLFSCPVSWHIVLSCKISRFCAEYSISQDQIGQRCFCCVL